MKPYTDKIDDVIEAERQHLAKDQPSPATVEYRPQYGLALSGGGIRSAAFALGVMQALVRAGVMSRIDYLSTVSGGGYIGSSLTWWLSRHALEGKQAGTSSEDFPFGRRLDGAYAKQAPGDEGDRKSIDATMQYQILDYLRQHGNYLTPGKGLNTAALGASLLRAVLVSLSVYFSLATLAMLAVLALIVTIRKILSIDILRWGSFGWGPSLPESLPDPQRMLASSFLGGAIAVGLLFATFCFVYSVLTLLYQLQQLREQKHKKPAVKGGWSEKRYRRRTKSQVALGAMLTTMLALLLIGFLPVLHGVFPAMWETIAAVSTLFVSGMLVVSLRFSRRPQNDGKNHVGHLIQPIIGMFLPLYGLLLGAFALATYILFDQEGFVELDPWSAGLVMVGVVVGLLVNVNYLGFHRIYRDRLMETFMPDKESVINNEWGPADGANDALIEEMCERRPYHIINTNVVLATSTKTKFRGRGGDSFILSPLYCGSEATGWRCSRDYMKRTDPGMTLATAMAISGAAANPHTGVGGEGLTRHRIVAILMSVLNLRLGFWAPNPRESGWWPPNFIYPGLTGVF